MGISLWLVPGTTPALADLQGVISELSTRHGSPLFVPHITLTTLPSSDQAVEQLQTVAASLAAPDLVARYRAVETAETFFQSVFIAMHLTDEMVAIRNQTELALQQAWKPSPHYPHLSLYYGETNREAVVEHLRSSGLLQITDDGVKVGSMSQFPVNEVWVVRCDGDVHTWNVVSRHRLIAQDV